ncbi:MAG: hypothetical protein H3C47_15795 [Candidatus Cloacimonetes bacterium]|nr:hypothetical protein [Candidatus Cloacimonadota bacterium]
MIAFEPFASLTETGIREYSGQWHSWVLREFNPYFLLYWMFLVLLIWLVRNQKIRLPVWNPSWLSWVVAVVPCLLCSFFVLVQTGGVPHFEDEFAYGFQARLLATSQFEGITVPKELEHTFAVPNIFINSEGKLVGIYSIGYPLFLAPFALLNVLWLAPIVLFVLNLGFLLQIIKTVFSKRRFVPWLVVCLNPWFCAFSAWYFSQSLTLLLVNWIILRRLQNRSFVGDGVLLGVMAIVRLPDALIVFLAILMVRVCNRDYKIYDMILGLPFLFLHFLQQKWVTGFWFLSTYEVFSKYHKMGFGADIGIHEPWGFNLWQAFKNLGLALLSLNETLFGFPALGLLPLVLFCIRGLWIIKRQGGLFLLVLPAIWFGFYFFYFYPGLLLGPRFHFPLLGCLMILALAGALRFRVSQRLCGVFVVVGFLSLGRWQDVVKDSGGILTDPLQEMGISIAPDKVYIIIEPEPQQNQSVFIKPLYWNFWRFNDPWQPMNPVFVAEKDFQQHKQWFFDNFKGRLVILSAEKEAYESP